MRWVGDRLVTRLAAITLGVGLVTGILGMGTVLVLERQNLVEEATAANLTAADRAVVRIDDRLASVRAKLGLIASRGGLLSSAADAETDLRIALRSSNDVDELLLYDRSGRPIATAAASRLIFPGELPDRNLEDVDPVTWSNAGDLPSLELVVPVEDPPGTVVAQLVGRIPVALVFQEAATQREVDGRTVFLTDAEGRIQAHPELDRVLAEERFDVEALAADPATSMGIDGRQMLVAGSRLPAGLGWVVVEQPRDEVIRRVDLLVTDFTWVFLAVVTAIIAAVIVTSRYLLRPLVALADATERVGQGDLSVRVDPGGPGEPGTLGREFNRMAGSLQERQSRLERAERAARDSEERLRLTLEGVEDYAIFLVTLEGRVGSWNTGGRRLLGYDAASAIGSPLAALFDELVGSRLLAEAADTGRAHLESWCVRRDGTRFWAQTDIATLYGGANDDPYAYAVILHDLTLQRDAQAALENALQRERDAAAELRRAAGLKDEFLAIAAHEIRTPLSAILGASQLLAREADTLDTNEQQEFHAMIEASASDMRDIVERLLDFTRLQAGRVRFEPMWFDLQRTLERHVGLLHRHLVAHDVVLEVADVEVFTDPELLRHVVTNLVSNAARFSPEGSQIVVTADVDDGVLELTVADEGPGIPPDDHLRIFELFRQSSRSEVASGGTGVGLAIVKRYVDLADGEIVLESPSGQGARFTIRLPLARATRASRPAAADPPIPAGDGWTDGDS